MSKRVYMFGADMTEGGKADAPLLGNKAANLAEMAKIGIPVPPGFAITTAECNAYLKNQKLTDELKKDIDEAVRKLEKTVGRKFGDARDPLLFSVRSGAIVSMPDALSVSVDQEGRVLSSQLHMADEGHKKRIHDHVVKLVERGRVYASAAGEKIDLTSLIEQKKPYYIDFDQAGNKRIHRAFIACGDR